MTKEYIEREAALDAITYRTIIEPTESDIVALTLAVAQKNIRKVPAADVVEVVRCKNCDYRDGIEDICGNIYCRLHDGRFDKDGYCSYGKRRTEDD